MDSARRLLDLQTLDTAIDRALARHAVLEGGTELKQARAGADAAEVELGELRLRIEALDREASRFEHDVDALGQKAAAEERRLYDGSVANPKELDSIQHEVANLKRRTGDREDELLVLMEQREVLDRQAAAAAARTEELRTEVERAGAGSAEELTTIERELAERRVERAAIADGIDPDLLELYEDLRRQKKGIGVAALVDGICQGCHEQLSAVVLDRLKKTDGVRRCEYCRRILVL